MVIVNNIILEIKMLTKKKGGVVVRFSDVAFLQANGVFSMREINKYTREEQTQFVFLNLIIYLLKSI